jgi:hypothetical protein
MSPALPEVIGLMLLMLLHEQGDGLTDQVCQGLARIRSHALEPLM